MPQTKLASCIIALALSVLFGLGVFFMARRSSLWVRFSCLFVGVLGAASAYLCFHLESHRQSLPYRSRAYLDHYSTLLAGAAMGALVVLAIYGLSFLYEKRHERPNQSLQPTAGRSNE
jgi:hypothetical protein